jgi:maltose O-acetyltransferase
MPRFFTKLMVNLFLALYYLFARHLPPSYSLAALGRISKIFRAFCCNQFFRATGRNINIEHGAYFGSGRLIEIGDNSGIGVNCHVPSDIRIGNDVMMGPEVLIIGQNQNHRFDDLTVPMRLQGHNASSPVVVEDDVWIGARVIILPGIKIGKGAILGAGAIVTRDVPPYAICVGNPARVVRFRNDIKNNP